MMKNKTYKFLTVALVSLLFGSCSDEFVDVEPVAAINSESFYSSMVQAEQAATVAYSTFCKTTAWDRDIVLTFGTITSDDAEGGGDFENEVPETEVYNRLGDEILTTSGALDATYGILYRGIYFANVAMEKMPLVLEYPGAKPDVINTRMAEMKFIRAINTMYLTHIFGEVPLVDHVLLPSEYNIPRATFRELYDFIEKDLLEAIEVLPERSELGANVGRASKGAARGLLARMYLYESSYARYYPGDARFEGLQERWGDVLDLCNDIFASGEYQLVGANGETFNTLRNGPNTNGYRYMFTFEGDNCAESLFEIQYNSEGNGYAVTRSGSLAQWISPRYHSNHQETAMWGLGWPTQSVYDEFEDGDIRRDISIAEQGDSVNVVIGGAAEWVPIDFSNTATGYYMEKFTLHQEHFRLQGNHDWQRSPANMKLIRLADIHLMAAEAAMVLGNNDVALEHLNAVRARSRACSGRDVPADLTGTVTLDDIVHERRCELVFEGFRYFDLVRWNLATEYINGETPGGFPIIFQSPKHDFMPLPAYQIQNNKALSQKYGW